MATADQVVVELTARTEQYQRNVDGAAAAIVRFEAKSSTALAGLEHSFEGLRAGAVKMTSGVDTALRRLERHPWRQKLSSDLDAALAKFHEFGKASSTWRAPMAMGGGQAGPFAPVVFAAEKAGGAVRAVQFNLGNLSAQFSDIGVTAAMGMNPLLIALQQGTQLSQAFAGQKLGEVAKGLRAAFLSVVSPMSLVTVGAVAAAAALVQWASSALSAEVSTKTFDEALKDLSDAIKAVKETTSALNTADLSDLQEKYGRLTSEVWRMVEAQQRLAELDAVKALRDTAAALKDFKSPGVRDMFTMQTGAPEALRLARELNVSYQQALEIATQINRVSLAEGPQAAASAFAELRSMMDQALSGQEEMSDEALSLYRAILQGEDAARQLDAATSGIGPSLDTATASASALADELGRAVSAAISLANASVNDLRVAQIERDFFNDPIGRAGALAGARFDASVGDISGAPIEVVRQIESRRAAYVSEQVEIAKVNEETRKLNETLRQGSRGGGGGGGGGGRAKVNELEREGLRLTEQMQTAQEEYNATLARYDQLLASGAISQETYNRAVADLGERLTQAGQFSASVSDTLRSSFEGLFSAIMEGGDGAARAVEGLGKRLAAMAAQESLFRLLASLMPGTFGKGGFVPLVASANGNVFNGGRLQAFARGGIVGRPTVFPMANGGVGLMGEAGPEAIMPLTRIGGRLGVRAQGGGGTVVQVVNNTGTPAREERSTAPDGREMVRVIVGEEIARGGLDRSMKGRYGAMPQKVMR